MSEYNIWNNPKLKKIADRINEQTGGEISYVDWLKTDMEKSYGFINWNDCPTTPPNPDDKDASMIWAAKWFVKIVMESK